MHEARNCSVAETGGVNKLGQSQIETPYVSRFPGWKIDKFNKKNDEIDSDLTSGNSWIFVLAIGHGIFLVLVAESFVCTWHAQFADAALGHRLPFNKNAVQAMGFE